MKHRKFLLERGITHFMSRYKRSALHEAGRPADQATANAGDPVWGELSSRGLFIIGHARSGTTILQDALNDSPDIFLFGEPNFHIDPGSPDFAKRYNHIHHSQGNQEMKGTHCPPFFPDDAPWSDYVLRLLRFYRYVGSKTAIFHEWDMEYEAYYNFHARNFYDARYIFTFRNPPDVLGSWRSLLTYRGRALPKASPVLTSYLRVIQLYVRMLRNFPHVSALFHEDISATSFVSLGHELGLKLDGCARYYSGERVGRHAAQPVADDEQAIYNKIVELYDVLKQEATAGFGLVQMSQNMNNLAPYHLTPLGRIYRTSEVLLNALAGRPVSV